LTKSISKTQALDSSVHIYFGSATQIAKTEPFRIHLPVLVLSIMDEKPIDLAVHIEDVASNETWTPTEEKRVRRSLDYHIVPIVFILYLLCFLDR